MDNDPGWPRPVLPAVDNLELTIKSVNRSYLPVMWVSGTCPEHGHWAGIDTDRMDCCKESVMCIVCGEDCKDNWVQAKLNSNPGDLATKGHVKCILLAVTNCPHFKDKYVVAEDSTGWPLTVQDLYRQRKEGL